MKNYHPPGPRDGQPSSHPVQLQLFCIASTFLAIPLSFVNAPYPQELVLQHTATVFGLACLAAAAIFATPTMLSFACVLIFVWLHMMGARWIYTFVPYDDLARSLVGTSLSEYFGWERNHYDRMVHFSSGLLGVPPASELLQRFGGMRPLGAAFMGISCVVTIGAFYEVLEWQIAMWFSPAQAEAYNGQQGDVWDPQKDLMLAGFGAMLSAAMMFRWTPSTSPASRRTSG